MRAISTRLMALLFVFLFAAFPVAAIAGNVRADSVNLTAPDTVENVPFAVENMFPGDAETKYFNISVRHKDSITLYYHADIRPGSEKLAEVMMLKVELPDKAITLYDGLMRDMPAALEHDLAADETQVLYRLTAYLDTSVGNDYQYKSLAADFRWWYMEEPGADITPASVTLTAEKFLDGQHPQGSAFTFTLKDEHSDTLQTVMNHDGMVEFESLLFNKEGRYTYTISETPGSDATIVYDPVVYTVIVTVTATDSAYTASVTYEKDGEAYLATPRFDNKTSDAQGTQSPDPETPPNTGDAGNAPLYIFIGIAAASVILLGFICKKKEGAV